MGSVRSHAALSGALDKAAEPTRAPTQILEALKRVVWVPEGMGARDEEDLGRRARASGGAVEDRIVDNLLQREFPARGRWWARISTDQGHELCTSFRAQVETLRSIAKQNDRALYLIAVGRSGRWLFCNERSGSFRVLALPHASSLPACSPHAQAVPGERAEQNTRGLVHEAAKWFTPAAYRASKRSRRGLKQFAWRADDRTSEPLSRSKPGDFEGLEERKVEFFRALRLQCAARLKGRASAR